MPWPFDDFDEPVTTGTLGQASSASEAGWFDWAPSGEDLYNALPSGETLSTIGHVGLDIVGFIPGVGEIADGVNAAWLAGEGNYDEALLTAIAMIPVVGDVVGKGGKYLLKIVKKGGPEAIAAARKLLNSLDPATIAKIRDYFDKFLPKDLAEKLKKQLDDLLARLKKTAGEGGGNISKKLSKEALEKKIAAFREKLGQQSVATDKDKLLVYSGLGKIPGSDVTKTANAVIDQTPAGIALKEFQTELAQSGLSGPEIWEITEPMWRETSVRLASEASGSVTAVLGPALRPNAVIFDELAALGRNPNVTSIEILKLDEVGKVIGREVH